MGITSGNGDLSRKREHLHALSLLDDLFPVAVVKSLAVYGIFTLLVNTLCEDRTQTVLQKLLVTRSRLVNTSCKLPPGGGELCESGGRLHGGTNSLE